VDATARTAPNMQAAPRVVSISGPRAGDRGVRTFGEPAGHPGEEVRWDSDGRATLEPPEVLINERDSTPAPYPGSR
jgi:hypothetical protein